MQRLSKFEKHIIADIHDIVYRAAAYREQLLLHPLRRRSDLDSLDRQAHIPRSTLAVKHFDIQTTFRAFGKFLHGRERELALDAVMHQVSIQVAGNSPVRSRIDPVGSNLVFDDRLALQSKIFLCRSSYHRVLRQHHNAVVTASYAELVLRANHSEALDSADLGLFDFEFARKDCPQSGEEHLLTSGDVGRTADDLKRFGASVIDLGNVQVVAVGMHLALQHLCDHNPGKAAGNGFAFLNTVNFNADGGHSICNPVNVETAFQIVLEPIVTELHIFNLLLLQILRFEKGSDKVLLIKLLYIVDSLSRTDKLHRDTVLVRHSDHDSALRRSVQLGHYQTGDVRCPGKFFRLRKCVLSGAGIDNEQYVVRAIRHHLTYDIANLGKFVHQVNPVVEPSCSVNQDDICVSRNCSTYRVVCDACWIGAHTLLYYAHSCPFSPDGELIHSCSSEGICSANNDRFALPAEHCCKFAYGGCLAYSVDADDKNDIRFFGKVERPGTVRYEFGYFRPQKPHQLVKGHILVPAHSFLKGIDYLESGIHTHIGLDERFLDRIQSIVIDP